MAGTVGALAMMPFGFAFRLAEMRVGHYGPKFAELYSSNPGPMLLFAQHIVLGWISALPLVAVLTSVQGFARALLLGVLYGIAYYILINALALPIYFGDALPWSLGLATVLPSLVIHVVFGLAVAYAERGGFWSRRVLHSPSTLE
ncbi:MAG: hypothetical protein V4858_11020 [Pseudomonadota bacterium]